MRGPPRPASRQHLRPEEVQRLLFGARRGVEKARADAFLSSRAAARLHQAEQVLLLVRLAADSGARRGELAALKFGDLDGRVLTIERGVSAGQLGPTKTGQVRRITLGRRTAQLWHTLAADWAAGPEGGLGPWLFSGKSSHAQRVHTTTLNHWFRDLALAADVPGASLHRLRHSVATFLVGRGDLLKAQQRLGHREASTTLRNYAHALPLEDGEVADALEELLDLSAPSVASSFSDAEGS
jgi:integrase